MIYSAQLLPSIPPDNNNNNDTVELLSYDDEDESNDKDDASPLGQSLPKNWQRCTTTKMQRKDDPDAPLFYYFITTAGQTS